MSNETQLTSEAGNPGNAPATTPETATPDNPAAPSLAPAVPPAPEATTPVTPPAAPVVPTAPEQYDFKAPEGMKFDDAILGDFSTFAKEKGLSQDEAQKVVDMGAKVAQQTRDAFMQQVEANQAQWVADSRVDKEFGGDNLDKNLAIAQRALATFGTPALKEMLDASGLGYHPEIVRAFYRVGQAISEDRLVSGSKAPPKSDPYTKMYPTMVKN